MKYILVVLLAILVIFSACKKKNNDPVSNDGWTQEDQAMYDHMLALQDTAYKKYAVWSVTMDSLDAIMQLKQYFLNDPIVSTAIIGSQGVAVQYVNGMRGGIFLDPRDLPGTKLGVKVPGPCVDGFSPREKGLVKTKKMILLDPHYWDRENYTNGMVAEYSQDLPRVGFSLETVYNSNATVDRFFHLGGYGIIQIYSHGWAYPAQDNITDVYVMTGEAANQTTTKNHEEDIKSGAILIEPTIVGYNGSQEIVKNVYWISGGLFATENQKNFSNDTILFYGGFCWSFFGHWPYINQTFAKGAYFGFNWSVYADNCCDWAKDLVRQLSDTTLDNPATTNDWMNNPLPKSYDIKKEGVTVNILYNGDPDLVLWKSPCDGFPPVGESLVYLDESHTWGLIFYFEAVSELLQGREVYRRRIATDPQGIGSYYACDKKAGQVEIAEDNSLPPYTRKFFTPPKPFVKFGAPVGTILTWEGTVGTSSSRESYEVTGYQDITIPYGTFTNVMVVRDKWYMEGSLVSQEYYWINPTLGLLKFVSIGQTDTMYLTQYTPPTNKMESQLANVSASQIVRSLKSLKKSRAKE